LKKPVTFAQALAVFRPMGCKTAFSAVAVAKLKFCNNLYGKPPFYWYMMM
jgi:hypothetical protein